MLSCNPLPAWIGAQADSLIVIARLLMEPNPMAREGDYVARGNDHIECTN